MSQLNKQLTKLIIETGVAQEYKDDIFITHTYNDLEVIYRQSDMYI